MLGNEWEILVAAFEWYKLLSLCKLCHGKLKQIKYIIYIFLYYIVN